MVFEHDNYRSLLKATLAEHGRKAACSLRQFAARVGVSSSYLSEVLSSKKALSAELALKMALKLGLTDAETQYLCLLVQWENEKDGEYRTEIEARLKSLNPRRKTHELSADLFKSIGEWHHAAILELTYLPGFELTPQRIARKIGIPAIEASLAIERLERLELLTRDNLGRYRKANGHVAVSSPVPSTALRSCHRQILEKAGAATSLLWVPK